MVVVMVTVVEVIVRVVLVVDSVGACVEVRAVVAWPCEWPSERVNGGPPGMRVCSGAGALSCFRFVYCFSVFLKQDRGHSSHNVTMIAVDKLLVL